MKYSVQMGSDAMMLKPRFMTIGFSIENVIVVEDIQVYRQHGYLISLPLFNKRKESRIRREGFKRLPDWKFRRDVGRLAVTEIIHVSACLGRIQTHISGVEILVSFVGINRMLK
jgi:hypothetical protein